MSRRECRVHAKGGAGQDDDAEEIADAVAEDRSDDAESGDVEPEARTA